MKIAVDAHCIGNNQTGLQTYTTNLVRNFLHLYPDYEWIVYTTAQGKSVLQDACKPPSKLRVLVSKSAVQRYLFELPRLARKDKPDVFHVQFYGPLFCRCPLVVTVHDISYEVFPRFFTAKDRIRLKTIVPYFLRKCSRIITVSNDSKNQIVTHYKISPDKIVAIHNGVDHDFFFAGSTTEDRQCLAALGIWKHFFLYVGDLQPRKNIESLLLAAAKAAPLMPEVQFVIAGPKGWLTHGIERIMRRHPELRSIVCFTGFVSRTTLRALYRNCLAFAYVPFYEGFGLPIVEAMACGAPVITSNTSCLPEIAGDGALLVDPYDVDFIAAALEEVYMSVELRKELSSKGIQRAGAFSWERSARSTFSVFCEVQSTHGKLVHK